MLLFALLSACEEDATSRLVQCDLEVAVAPSDVAPGETVTATGRPFSTETDTAVRVGGLPAEVVDVARADCEVCDACRVTAECDACETCDACAATCASCVETVVFTVPELGSGTWPVVLTNRYGGSSAVSLIVTAPSTDTGDTDTGDTDTGDTGDTDTGDTSDTADGGDTDTGA